MKCSEYKYLLPDFINGNLEAEERCKIEQHIIHCEYCKSELSALLELFRELRNRQEQPPDERYFSTLLSRIHQRLDETNKSLSFIPFIRYASPVMAVLFFIAVISKIFIPSHDNNLVTVETSLKNFSPNEVEYFLSHQQYFYFTEVQSTDVDTVLLSDSDREILQELLSENSSLYSNIHYLYEDFSANEIDELIKVFGNTQLSFQ